MCEGWVIMKTKAMTEKEVHRRERFLSKLKTQLGYYVMIIPAVCCLLLFNYIPMAGIYLAFIDFKPAKGILGSKFVGLKHFKTFFTSLDFERVFRNTLLYNVARIALVSLLAGVVFALLLYEIRSKVANKVFHTCMLLPSFLSWSVVSAALLILLHADNGMINSILEFFGLPSIHWYQSQQYWPTIILLCMIYKGAGMASIYFYSALLSIDTELFAAAQLDGANRLQQIWHISLPALSKVFCITLIMSLGSVLSTNMSPYYELTFNQGALYETTQVIGTYIFNGLGGGRFSFMAAVGLVQSVIGVILVVSANTIVKKVDEESAMF